VRGVTSIPGRDRSRSAGLGEIIHQAGHHKDACMTHHAHGGDLLPFRHV
jgi:hypothetical protein